MTNCEEGVSCAGDDIASAAGAACVICESWKFQTCFSKITLFFFNDKSAHFEHGLFNIAEDTFHRYYSRISTKGVDKELYISLSLGSPSLNVFV